VTVVVMDVSAESVESVDEQLVRQLVDRARAPRPEVVRSRSSPLRPRIPAYTVLAFIPLHFREGIL
jgi:hypothetical protein